MRYTQVSEPVMCDLLNCKSIVTDLKILVDEYSIQLERVNLLSKINEILYSRQYDPTCIGTYWDDE